MTASAVAEAILAARPRDTPTELAEELRADLRRVVQGWLADRSETLLASSSQVMEEYLTRLETAHASERTAMRKGYEARLAELEHRLEDKDREARRQARVLEQGAARKQQAPLERLRQELQAERRSAREKVRRAEREGRERLQAAVDDLERRLRARDEEVLQLQKEHALTLGRLEAKHERELRARDERLRALERRQRAVADHLHAEA